MVEIVWTIVDDGDDGAPVVCTRALERPLDVEGRALCFDELAVRIDDAPGHVRCRVFAWLDAACLRCLGGRCRVPARVALVGLRLRAARSRVDGARGASARGARAAEGAGRY